MSRWAVTAFATLSYWDTQKDDWSTPSGTYTVYVGNSSDNITMREEVTIRVPNRG